MTLNVNHIFEDVQFLVKVADWRTDGRGIKESQSDDLFLKLRAAIYDGVVEELWSIDGFGIK